MLQNLNTDLVGVQSPLRMHNEASLSNILGATVNGSNISSDELASNQYFSNWGDRQIYRANLQNAEYTQKAIAHLQSKIRSSEFQLRHKSGLKLSHSKA